MRGRIAGWAAGDVGVLAAFALPSGPEPSAARSQALTLQVFSAHRDRTIPARRVASLAVSCPRGSIPSGWGFRPLTRVGGVVAPVGIVGATPTGSGATGGWRLDLRNLHARPVKARGTAICLRGTGGLATALGSPFVRQVAGARAGPALEAQAVAAELEVPSGKGRGLRLACPAGNVAPADFGFETDGARLAGVRLTRQGVEARFEHEGQGGAARAELSLVCLRATGLQLELSAKVPRTPAAAAGRPPRLRFRLTSDEPALLAKGTLVGGTVRADGAPLALPAPAAIPGDATWGAREPVLVRDEDAPALAQFTLFLAFHVLAPEIERDEAARRAREALEQPITTRSLETAKPEEAAEAPPVEIRNDVEFSPLTGIAIDTLFPGEPAEAPICRATLEPLPAEPRMAWVRFLCTRPIRAYRIALNRKITGVPLANLLGECGLTGSAWGCADDSGRFFKASFVVVVRVEIDPPATSSPPLEGELFVQVVGERSYRGPFRMERR